MHKNNAQQVHTGDARQVQPTAQPDAQNAVLDAVNVSRRERKAALMNALVNVYRDNPKLGATEAGRLLGVHRNTIYTYTGELEAVGRLRKSGSGWDVL